MVEAAGECWKQTNRRILQWSRLAIIRALMKGVVMEMERRGHSLYGGIDG